MISLKLFLFEPESIYSEEKRISIYIKLYKEYFTKRIIERWHVLTTLKFLIYQDWQVEYTTKGVASTSIDY